MMRLTQFHPQGDWVAHRAEIDRLFDGLLGRSGNGFEFGADWLPAVDVREGDDRYRFRVDLPGIDPRDVKLQVVGSTVSLRGERKLEPSSDDREVVHRSERVSGAFERTFELGTPVDASKVRATYKDGVLDIDVPKLEEAKTRDVAIEVA